MSIHLYIMPIFNLLDSVFFEYEDYNVSEVVSRRYIKLILRDPAASDLIIPVYTYDTSATGECLLCMHVHTYVAMYVCMYINCKCNTVVSVGIVTLKRMVCIKKVNIS